MKTEVSTQTRNFIECLIDLDKLCTKVCEAVTEAYGQSQVDSVMDEKYMDKHFELKSVIQQFICYSIDDKLHEDNNEI